MELAIRKEIEGLKTFSYKATRLNLAGTGCGNRRRRSLNLGKKTINRHHKFNRALHEPQGHDRFFDVVH